MCGIVGVISLRSNGFMYNDVDLFEELLVLDTLRGLDSTGAFSVDSQRNVNSVKIASHPHHLFACDEWKSWRGRANSIGRILIGHNRKATKGSVNSDNAHPFHVNNIMLVHNGSLREDHKKSYKDVDVDSHALAHAFAEKGAENVLPNIDGAFALVWWDIEKERLFAVRNDERPLALVRTDELLVIASEPWMAHALLARKGKKVISTIDIEPGNLFEFKLNGQYSVSDIKLKEPTTYEGYTVRHYQHGGAHHASSVSGGKSATECGTGQEGLKGSSCSTTGQKTTSPSAQTALTLVKTNPPSTSPQSGGKDVIPDDNNGHVPCDDYPKDKRVLVKFYESKLSESKQFNILKGKALEPGGAEIDVLAYQRVETLSGAKLHEVLSGPVLVTVVKHSASVCGRSIYVRDITIPDTVEVHNGRITAHEWNYVLAHCKCKACDAKIYEEEQFFTGITRKANNKLVVTCPDCIEDKLIGDFKYEFNQSRLAAVQATVAKREELAGRTGNGTEGSGSPTLH